MLNTGGRGAVVIIQEGGSSHNTGGGAVVIIQERGGSSHNAESVASFLFI